MGDASQPGILLDIPAAAIYLRFERVPDATPKSVRAALSGLTVDDDLVLGLGPSLVSFAGSTISGLHEAPLFEGPGIALPATPAALWLWLRGEDPGELLHRTRALGALLAPTFGACEITHAFRYDGGRDLTGYEDGTENPTGEDAIRTALREDGSSFVAVQKWRHDLSTFSARSRTQQDHTIGRRRSDNEELDDAPASAHVKRTAQESFDPEAFVVRRSMPWADADGEGLVFVAFGASFDAFEALARRMVGADDSVVDALFSFTRPISSAYFWCPPLRRDGTLDLSELSA